MARKGKYEEWLEPDNLILLQGWRRDGLRYDQIAANIGINEATLYDWINKYDEISKALKKGEEVCIYEVENALYKAAIGYDVTETERIETEFPDGSVTTQKKAKKRHIPPSIGAICFILKNRRSNKWQDKPTVIDTTALNKLDEILKEAKEAAENEVQPETE
jgi:transposase-like protein